MLATLDLMTFSLSRSAPGAAVPSSRSAAGAAVHRVTPLVTLLGCLLWWMPAPAPAQTTGTGTGTGTAMPQPGTCMGTINGKAVSGNVYLEVDGKVVTPVANSGGTFTVGLFNQAECECAASATGLATSTPPTAINLRIVMNSGMAAPVGVQGSVAMYIGTDDCTNTTTRATSCVSIPIPAVSPDVYAGLQVSSTAVLIPIPADQLIAPATPNPPVTPGTCSGVGSGTTRNVYLFFGANVTSSTPDAYCQLSLPVNTVPPAPPTGVAASPGNQSVTLSWDTPTIQGVEGYQILCREITPDPMYAADGGVVLAMDNAGYPQNPYYEVCIGGTLHRRVDLPFSGQVAGTVDGGFVTGLPDMYTAVGALHRGLPPYPQRIPGRHGHFGIPVDLAGADLAGADLASTDLASTDLSTAPDLTGADQATPDMATLTCPDMGSMGSSPLDTLDPKYLCNGGEIKSATSASINNLRNGHLYEFEVVAIDFFGNPAGSCRVTATPQPTLNLIEGLYNAGNDVAGFGCGVTGAGAAGIGAGCGGLLGLVALWLLGRRRGAGKDRGQGTEESP